MNKKVVLSLCVSLLACGGEDKSAPPPPESPPVAEAPPAKTNTKVVAARPQMTEAQKAAQKAKDKAQCDAALTSADLKDICKKSITLKPTFVEGMAMNPCNRQGSGLNFIVSRHGSAKTAQAGQKVSEPKDKSTETSFAASVSVGNHLIEMRARKGTACASVDKVTELAKKAAQAYR